MFETTERVLVLSPHADNESLGCAGTILRYREKIETLDIALCGVASITHREGHVATVETRVQEFQKACRRMMAVQHNLGFEDRKLHETFAGLVTTFDKLLDQTQPTVVFAPYVSFHQDHRTVYEATFAALRPKRHKSVKLVLLYETGEYGWFVEHEAFIPNIYVSLTEQQLSAKLQTIGEYSSQGRADIDQVIAYAQKRGIEVEVDYAESFRIARAVL